MRPVDIHRDAVRALILTPSRELLLLRIQLPEVAEPFWIAPGGGLEPGEHAEDGLRRELCEEVGLVDFETGPLVWRRQHTFTFKGQRICQREEYFVVHAARFQPSMSDVLEREVVREFRWWPVSALAQASERLSPLALARIMETFLAEGPPRVTPELEVLVD